LGIKTFRPVTPSQRYRTVPDFEEITKKSPVKSLTEAKPSKGGRNSHGHVTMRHRGGGHKRRYRIVDFKRDKHGIPAKVEAIEYDPNRSARLALLLYADGERRYILAPEGLVPGMTVVSGQKVEPQVGNAMQLANILEGTFVHAIELRKGQGAVLVRSAGGYAQLMAKEGGYAHLKLPSTEVRLVPLECQATLGQVGNLLHNNVSIGKAGAQRWRGRKPRNRGVAMNPVDHPMGGGEGKSSGGRHPCSPWGQIAKGLRTRRNRRTDRMIVRGRKR